MIKIVKIPEKYKGRGNPRRVFAEVHTYQRMYHLQCSKMAFARYVSCLIPVIDMQILIISISIFGKCYCNIVNTPYNFLNHSLSITYM